ncbi:hypothetical protein Trydic_g11672 [Trypoxylus dichotomus]
MDLVEDNRGSCPYLSMQSRTHECDTEFVMTYIQTMVFTELLIRNELDPQFASNIVCPDEFKFKLNGDINKRKHVHWSNENSHHIIKDVNFTDTTCWTGAGSKGIVVLFSFDAAAAGACYLEFLEDVFSQVQSASHFTDM